MLARLDDLDIDLGVQVVGRAVVHHLDLRIGEQLFNVLVAARDVVFSRFALRQLVVDIGDGDQVGKADPAHRLDVADADVAHADDACLDRCHFLPPFF